MGRITSIILVAVTLLVVFVTVTGNHGVLRLFRLSEELEQLRQKNGELESEIIDLTNNVYALRESNRVLEKNAREQLGLSKPGEIVYIFPQTEQREQQKASSKQ